MPPSQAQPQQPYHWPPDSITASYMKFHLDRSKELHGRMCKLHQKTNARHPRKPAKKKHKHGHPKDYLSADSSFFSPSGCQLMIALQKHRHQPPLNYRTLRGAHSPSEGLQSRLAHSGWGSQQTLQHHGSTRHCQLIHCATASSSWDGGWAQSGLLRLDEM